LTVQDIAELDRIQRKILPRRPDVGARWHVNFLKKSQRIHYLAIPDPTTGLLLKTDGTPWNTGILPEPWVMDEYGNLFIGLFEELHSLEARLNHSTLCAGKAITCAGEIRVVGGRLTWLTNNSGHYQPTQADFYVALCELRSAHAD